MSTTKKQIGDRIRITGGQYKNSIGKLVAKERRGWMVELEDGQQVAVSFPMVILVEAAVDKEVEATVVREEPQQQPPEAENAGEAEPAAETHTAPEQSNEGNDQEITKMTVKQLQVLAKQRGIGIARTKSDFLRIIKEKNPDEDLDQLTGKTLFNRVSELHISRLRTKEDLVRMLTA